MANAGSPFDRLTSEIRSGAVADVIKGGAIGAIAGGSAFVPMAAVLYVASAVGVLDFRSASSPGSSAAIHASASPFSRCSG